MKKIISGLLLAIALRSFARADQWIVGHMVHGLDGKIIFTKDATFSANHPYQLMAGPSTCIARVNFPGTVAEIGSLTCGITTNETGIFFSTNALCYDHNPSYLTVMTTDAGTTTMRDSQDLYIVCKPEAKK